jgi:hypothetical protein
MNLMQVLHTRWAADSTLNALLSSTKVHTGRFLGIDDTGDPDAEGAEEPEFPYATITRPGGPSNRHTNESTVRGVLIRITVYHGLDYYDEGAAIADAVEAAFDRADFDLSGSDKVVNMQMPGDRAELQDDDGDWYFLLDFMCQTYEPAA